MKSGHREQGTAGEAGRASVQQSRQTAPGKVTLTSKLPGRQGGAAVQRKAAPGAGAAGILSGNASPGPAEVDWSAAVSLPDADAGSAQEAPVQRQEAVRPPRPAGGEGAQAGNDPLQVDRGQLTFDAEGTEGGRFHSRRAHWPGGVSGVTIGRGYDLGQHSATQIQADLAQAGVSAGAASSFAGAAGLTGNAARDWLQANRGSLSEISLEQQEALFNIAYARLSGDVERISGNYARTMGQRTGRNQDEFEIDFARLHPAIRDTLVDLRYRGDYTPTTRQRVQPPAIANDLRAMYDVIRDRAYWMQQRGVPEDRFNRRVRFLEAALGVNRQQGAQAQPQGGAAPAEQPAAPGGAQPGAQQPAGATQAAQPPAPEVQPTEPGERGGAAPAPRAPAPDAGAQQPAQQAQQAQQAGAQQAGTPATFTVTASSLNIRSAADAGSTRLGALRRGERITGTPVGNGWVQITFQGQPAFISAQHVTTGEGPAQQPQPEQPQTTGNGERSGAQWVRIANANGWSNTTAFSALDASWGPRAEAFVNGLRAAGASVRITAGLRHPNRAFLMHYAWGVAHGQYTPAQANAACRGRGIDIQWDHGNAAASRAAAQALVSAFGLVHQASITSNHVRGLAIDMEISGLPASITFNGQTYSTRRGASGSAAASSVAPIGRANGVIWFGAGDYVHWSQNGR
ncbi:MAG TPA: pesticin C-terminus-like muramidase [Haliangium sp.]|nr:pesticin C-terminus-like muramidase [Haliangium sp.]